MSPKITPELFIQTLAAMLEVERERKTVRLLSQNRAKAAQFKSRHTSPLSEDLVAVDKFQRPSQAAPRFFGVAQYRNPFSLAASDHQFQEYPE